jgi:hypothetical protein
MYRKLQESTLMLVTAQTGRVDTSQAPMSFFSFALPRNDVPELFAKVTFELTPTFGAAAPEFTHCR